MGMINDGIKMVFAGQKATSKRDDRLHPAAVVFWGVEREVEGSSAVGGRRLGLVTEVSAGKGKGREGHLSPVCKEHGLARHGMAGDRVAVDSGHGTEKVTGQA